MAEDSEQRSTLFDPEERRLDAAGRFLADLRDVLARLDGGETISQADVDRYLRDAAGQVESLMRGYRHSIRHQRQLMRHSDRSQEALRQAKEELANKSQRLEDLNDQLTSEIEQRKSLEQQLRDLATTDSLTGVAGRRHFMDLANQELAHSARYGSPLAALILDIDHFKHVNDTHGHAVGDAVLIAVAAKLRDNLRSADVLGRLGGEEFACILPETDAAGAQALAERIRRAVAADPVPVDAPVGNVPVTVSLGFAGFAGAADGLEALLQRCDRALYAAKEHGRNCCLAA